MVALRLILLLGVLASAFAVGLRYAVASMRGTAVSGDMVARDVLLSFVITTATVLVLRRRGPTGR
jgi:hypothetical protein